MKTTMIDCCSLCPIMSERAFLGYGSLVRGARISCRCLVIENKQSLTLVDTGLGVADLENPIRRLGLANYAAIRPEKNKKLLMVEKLRELGYEAKDVTDIIITHLDPDHAGGLSDFPNAKVHLHQDEWEVAVNQKKSPFRYRKVQYAHVKDWQLYREFGETWQGFQAVRAIPKSDDQILIVPLPGHSRGSIGIAVETEKGWIFHAGDAFYQYSELQDDPPITGFSIFGKQLADNQVLRQENIERLKQLHQDTKTQLICSHDTSVSNLL